MMARLAESSLTVASIIFLVKNLDQLLATLITGKSAYLELVDHIYY
jgi:hypothetical protein